MARAAVQTAVERWREAGLIDAATAQRILEFEQRREKSTLSVVQLLAIGFGVVLLGAGLLLFVAAHWDNLSPSQRFLLVLGTMTGIHIAAALCAQRAPQLSRGLHAVGTIALGAAIFLTGQIFNLEEHWPGGFLLWAAGAWLAYLVLRDWIHAALAALLTPAWLVGEWIVAAEHYYDGAAILSVGVALLATVYLGAIWADERAGLRRTLRWFGGLALIPAIAIVWFSEQPYPWGSPLPMKLRAMGWAAAIVLPLLAGWWLCRERVWMNGVAALWLYCLSKLPPPWSHYAGSTGTGLVWHGLSGFLWLIVGSILLIWWGVYEQRRERVNLGVAGFALAVLAFYFSDLLDMLGRSWSLILFGVIFLAGGYLLERTRRRLIARIEEART